MSFRLTGALRLLPLLAVLAPAAAQAQHRIGFIDSGYILERIPDYQTAQQQLERQAQQWQSELDGLKAQIRELEQDFIARELLFTEDERQRRREAISERRREHDALRLRFFGPEGELFREQARLLRPIQERLLAAVEEVAREGNYDYVFDKGGDFLFLYARAQHDLSDRVLAELGIDMATRTAR